MVINMKITLAAVIGFMLSTAAVAGSCDFDDFPVMSEMSMFPVLGNAVHNNRPMMVKGFSADVTMEQVIEFYHKKWRGRSSDSVYAQWNQVSTLTDECLMTVQIAGNGDNSQGRLVISNVPTISADSAMGEGVIKPSDANVISDLITNDGPKNGRVTLMATGGSPAEVARFYQSSLSSWGWKQQQNFTKDGSRVLIFRKGLNVMNILLVPTPEFTQVLINTETVD